MGYIISFLPWIAYAVLPASAWLLAAIIGLVLAAGLLARQLVRGRSFSDCLLEAGTTVYFAALTVVAIVAPHSGIRTDAKAYSLIWLAVLAWGSLVARRPFTLGVAKDMVPKEVWTAPLFVRTNMIITSVWAAAFTVTGAILFVLHASGNTARTATIVQILGFVVPIVFTTRYSKHVSARAAALAPTGEVTR